MRFKGIEDHVRVVRVTSGEGVYPHHHYARAARWPARWALLAGVALIAVAVAVIAGVILARRSGPAAEATAPFTADIASTGPLGDHRTVVAAGTAGTYVVQQQGGTGGDIERIPPGKTTPDPKTPLDVIPLGASVGADGAWVVAVPSFRSNSALLVHIPVYGSMTQVSIPGRPDCTSIAIVSCNPVQGGGSIWVAESGRASTATRQAIPSWTSSTSVRAYLTSPTGLAHCGRWPDRSCSASTTSPVRLATPTTAANGAAQGTRGRDCHRGATCGSRRSPAIQHRTG